MQTVFESATTSSSSTLRYYTHHRDKNKQDHVGSVSYLGEPLGEETVTVDLNQLRVLVAILQHDRQLLSKSFAQRRLAGAWWTYRPR